MTGFYTGKWREQKILQELSRRRAGIPPDERWACPQLFRKLQERACCARSIAPSFYPCSETRHLYAPLEQTALRESFPCQQVCLKLRFGCFLRSRHTRT